MELPAGVSGTPYGGEWNSLHCSQGFSFFVFSSENIARLVHMLREYGQSLRLTAYS